MAASPNGTVVTGIGASITDGSGNVWTIDGSGQIDVNGQVDPTTANVDELAFTHGWIWQKNADNNWYFKTSVTAPWVQSPALAAPVIIPGVSANDATIAAGSAATLVDNHGNVWGMALVDGTRGFQVTVNGVVDMTTANLVRMAMVQGKIWQENTAGLWYSKTTPASAWSAGTATDPVPVASVPSHPTWVGGGDNLASDPADWSPNGAPVSGQSLVMGAGTMNVAGNALANDFVTVSPGVTANFNTIGNTTLGLKTTTPGENININADPTSTLTLTAALNGALLTVNGGNVQFLSNSTFSAFRTVFSNNVVGNGTLNLFGGNASGESMEINGFVDSGLTFNIASGPIGDAGLQIDQPAAFFGAIDMKQAGWVDFSGLQATSGELLNGVLQMFNGSQLVAAVRFTDSANPALYGSLQLQQTSMGVAVSVGGGHFQPGGTGTVLPLATA